MESRGKWYVALAVGLAVVLAGPAQAAVVQLGPFGAGGSLNAYSLNATGMTWDAARIAAANKTFAGVSGHLATIGGAAENALVDGLGGDMWIGLTDSDATSSLDGATMPGTEGTFVWLTGEPVSYTNWHGGEPNNYGSGEDATQMRSDNGKWNDHRAGVSLGETDQNFASAVEYETNTLDPTTLPALSYRERKASSSFPGTPGGARAAKQGQIQDLADAELLLSLAETSVGFGSEKTGYVDILDIYGTGGGHGNFTADEGRFLIGGDHFVAEAKGFVYIPSAGQWTFGTNTDDGSGLWIGTQSKINDVLAGPHNHLATFTFGAAGWQPIRLVFFEATGGDEVELFAAQGAHTGFNSSFALVGDVANGGLAVKPLPEPATMALLGLGATLLGIRRRKRSA